MESESLVVPQANAAEEAGKLPNDLSELWAGANLEERSKLLLCMLDAVYVDAQNSSDGAGIFCLIITSATPRNLARGCITHPHRLSPG